MVFLVHLYGHDHLRARRARSFVANASANVEPNLLTLMLGRDMSGDNSCEITGAILHSPKSSLVNDC